MFNFIDEYTYYGLFYTKVSNGTEKKCRKYLDIKKLNTKVSSPQLMVIMMNPGASTPCKDFNDQDEAVETTPDKTQGQIVAVMKECSLEYVRIVNLSDLREPKSKIFYKNIDPQDSIFSPSNKADFDEIFIKFVPVLIACGVHDSLDSLVKQAITVIGDAKIIGVKKKNCINKYYHAKPWSNAQKLLWVNDAAEQIKKTKDYYA